MNRAIVPANKFISMIYRYTRRYFARELQSTQLDAGQLPFLLHLYRSPGVTQEQLSCALGMDKGTTARSVAQLEEFGLIYRTPDKNDRRINHVFPSQAALAREEELFAIIHRLHELLFEGFSDEERAQALSLIIRMKDNIE
ncbi:MAG TPA: MarR family transcriptional regulator, partial [Clostridia bacterium]|nr:MarR family transcriptional regulator [Clostridia bacterium]